VPIISPLTREQNFKYGSKVVPYLFHVILPSFSNKFNKHNLIWANYEPSDKNDPRHVLVKKLAFILENTK
jgi:hypothetical protein